MLTATTAAHGGCALGSALPLPLLLSAALSVLPSCQALFSFLSLFATLQLETVCTSPSAPSSPAPSCPCRKAIATPRMREAFARPIPVTHTLKLQQTWREKSTKKWCQTQGLNRAEHIPPHSLLRPQRDEGWAQPSNSSQSVCPGDGPTFGPGEPEHQWGPSVAYEGGERGHSWTRADPLAHPLLPPPAPELGAAKAKTKPPQLTGTEPERGPNMP